MDLFTREAELREQFENNQVQFLLTELDTATTFCEVAKAAQTPEKRNRNVGNAMEGYDTAVRLSHGVHFNAESQREYDTKLAHLRALLKELGQHIPVEPPA